ncbi:forkhead transcription factor 3 [Kwoniella mangroviensis CBS 8886]|nr:forkhead transcription factor 3 [Kwoniella mangroviensis CBS 8886]
MPAGKESLFGAVQSPPTRTSPRKTSNNNTTTSINRLYPTPLSMSPSTSSSISISVSTSTNNGNGIGSLRFPPSFDPNHPSSSRYHSTTYTPYSPYRPGEYGRSERGLASERTKIERKLFDDDDDDGNDDNDHNKEEVEDDNVKQQQDRLTVDTNKKEGSSPLAPAFQAKMVLRNGASIDLISWLRTNFHHLPPPHTVLTPCMPLNGIRHLLLERFPRAPEVEEISKAVLAAFPHSQWDYPSGTSSEPPNIRGLVWHGKDITDEEDIEPVKQTTTKTSGINGGTHGSSKKNKQNQSQSQSRSPTQSTLVSPISSSKRQLPDTPATRSVLEEFAEIATLADKTPTLKAKSLPGDHDIDVNDTMVESKKRRASQSPESGFSSNHRRRASTPDKLHGLLAAAEAVEGSPITSLLTGPSTTHSNGHKRRRTIGGFSSAKEMMSSSQRKFNRSSRGTLSPPPQAISKFNFLPQLNEDIDYLVPLNDTTSNNGSGLEQVDDDHEEEDAISTSLRRKAPNSSSTSQSSIISSTIPSTSTTSITGGTGSGRKVNELPTEGDAPGYDCKPPYPYHEMIRHAIESAPDCRLQLSQIYSSIADRFPFFKTLDEKKTAGWQNSIRHNLSLKKMFVRVNKPDGTPDDSGGKGGWWTVQPGVPDEGRPGRKAKAKKAKAEAEAEAGAGAESTTTTNGEIDSHDNSSNATHIGIEDVKFKYNDYQNSTSPQRQQQQQPITTEKSKLPAMTTANHLTQVSVHEMMNPLGTDPNGMKYDI